MSKHPGLKSMRHSDPRSGACPVSVREMTCYILPRALVIPALLVDLHHVRVQSLTETRAGTNARMSTVRHGIGTGQLAGQNRCCCSPGDRRRPGPLGPSRDVCPPWLLGCAWMVSPLDSHETADSTYADRQTTRKRTDTHSHTHTLTHTQYNRIQTRQKGA